MQHFKLVSHRLHVQSDFAFTLNAVRGGGVGIGFTLTNYRPTDLKHTHTRVFKVRWPHTGKTQCGYLDDLDAEGVVVRVTALVEGESQRLLPVDGDAVEVLVGQGQPHLQVQEHGGHGRPLRLCQWDILMCTGVYSTDSHTPMGTTELH